MNTQILDALNVSQYATQADIDSSLASELTNYWDQGQTSAEIASQISSSGLLTEAQGDARYHPVNGNAGGGGIIRMVLDNFTPRMIRALLPQAPFRANLILGNSATVQLTCDCYSKSESDGRYFSNTDYAPLDSRYHVVNGRAESFPWCSTNDPRVAAPGANGYSNLAGAPPRTRSSSTTSGPMEPIFDGHRVRGFYITGSSRQFSLKIQPGHRHGRQLMQADTVEPLLPTNQFLNLKAPFVSRTRSSTSTTPPPQGS